MIQFEESRKLYLDSYREYIKYGCMMNGSLYQIKNCIDIALRQQYLDKELDGRRIAYIKCEPSTFSFSVDATFYLLPFEPFTIKDDWSAKEKSIISEVNQYIVDESNSFYITEFNNRLGGLKHHLAPVSRMDKFFYMENIENIDIHNIKIE